MIFFSQYWQWQVTIYIEKQVCQQFVPMAKKIADGQLDSGWNWNLFYFLDGDDKLLKKLKDLKKNKQTNKQNKT